MRGFGTRPKWATKAMRASRALAIRVIIRT